MEGWRGHCAGDSEGGKGSVLFIFWGVKSLAGIIERAFTWPRAALAVPRNPRPPVPGDPETQRPWDPLPRPLSHEHWEGDMGERSSPGTRPRAGPIHRLCFTSVLSFKGDTAFHTPVNLGFVFSLMKINNQRCKFKCFFYQALLICVNIFILQYIFLKDIFSKLVSFLLHSVINLRFSSSYTPNCTHLFISVLWRFLQED